MLGVALDKGLDEGCFAHAWRTNDGDNERGRLFWEAVDKRNVQALFFNLGSCQLDRWGIRQKWDHIVRASSLLL